MISRFILMLAGCLLCAQIAQAAGVAEHRIAHTNTLRGGQAPQCFSADVTGWKTVVLVAKGYSWGQAVWGEPVLWGADGTQVRVTDLKPVSAQVGWGEFFINKGPDGQRLKVGGREFTNGLFAHADSFVAYQLDAKYTNLTAWVGVNHTANTDGKVKFELRDLEGLEKERLLAQLKRGFTRECFASLHWALNSETQRKKTSTQRIAFLRSELQAYEQDFEVLRRAIETDLEPVRERLKQFQALVRQIRVLKLDAPLLFVKRKMYDSPHIYDDFLTWHPGGGIYAIENPAAPLSNQVVRPVIDPKTRESLSEGVYRDPELSFDGKRLLFAFKGEKEGDTSIYEIGIDGSGLRRLTNPGRDCPVEKPPENLYGKGQHDTAPSYLPDGRIVFLSTRTGGLVLCFNNYIATLHTMNSDGSDIKCISVNPVSEFDPTVLPDGRILYGRWEYVDKTALYLQSLWTINPDGTHETALFKNNLAKPTAVLDARPVPGTDLVVASLTPHNGQSVGAIAMIDVRQGKNKLAAITNFTPEYPTEMDQGLKKGPCDPWPLDTDTVLIANNAETVGAHGVIELLDRFGFRFVIRSEPDISCYSPMLVKPQPVPAHRPPLVKSGEAARFFVHDIYRGLPGVARGEVKELRVIETTARVSGVPKGGRWWNQAFLVSWQGSYDIKNFLGVVPVEEDGSVCFEAPPGKALYFQALDKEHRLIQSMRTFVQAVPGVTRSCQGCHVPDDDAAPNLQANTPLALQKPPAQLQPESWGRGFIDYPSMIQPILDRHCVHCHGGEDGMAAGLDYSGGWTWAFNISYETFIKNTLTGFLNCENGQVKTAEILPPRTHGSAIAPLAQQLVDGHHGRIREMTRKERELLLAWMDGNCNYYGTWDYTEHATWGEAETSALQTNLLAQMDKAGCLKCHKKEIGNDWVNLAAPESSRMLRAPLASGEKALNWCRDCKAKPLRFTILLKDKQPPDVFKPVRDAAPDRSIEAKPTFKDTSDPVYRAMLQVIEQGRAAILKKPRIDMPGAVIIKGKCRELPELK